MTSTPPPQPPALVADGLRKSYGDKLVLDSIDLTVPPGTVFALLGPNGAGKTTAVEILSTLISPDAGTARILGHDLATEPDAVRARIGVTGQFSAIDGLLTAEENLLLMADLVHLDREEGRRRATDLLARFDLTDVAKNRAATFSGGMKRRLDLAMTLIGDPQLIFLDEPTTGLDPRSRRAVWDIVRELVADGVTIFLTTQYLEEADQLADTIAVLDHGTLVAQGTSAELKRLVPTGHVEVTLTGGETRRLPYGGDVRSLRTILDELDAADEQVADLAIHTPDLDDVFLALTGDPRPTEAAR
ncbi:ATP-binding cassette domain-containing protein [Mumia zhuanghuii]|uniref:ABC transporter ATP-binding protein n=2 Tax=Mumia TaxID=1546255 RepID=A0ABW1QMV5_9ACTN|nr:MULTISPECIES: ATP-binding cassette domain-containing protein [Mumia]KAA1424891.1 ATP-binding cassette domain-containing protein [Mumia zhuanghuii]